MTIKDIELEIKTHIDKGVHSKIQFDKRRFQQVLINILSNAVKFQSNGTIQVICTMHYNVISGGLN